VYTFASVLLCRFIRSAIFGRDIVSKNHWIAAPVPRGGFFITTGARIIQLVILSFPRRPTTGE